MTRRSQGQQLDDYLHSKKNESTWDSLVRYMQRSVRWQMTNARPTRRRSIDSGTTSRSKSAGDEDYCGRPMPRPADTVNHSGALSGASFLFPLAEAGVPIVNHVRRAEKKPKTEKQSATSVESVCEPMSAAIEFRPQAKLPAGKGIAPPPPPPPPPGYLGTSKSSRTQGYFEFCQRPACRLRTLNWSRIPEYVVWSADHENIWRKIFDKHCFQKEVQRLDMRELETLFASKAVIKRHQSSLVQQKTIPKKVSLLEKSRAVQIGVGLRSLRLNAEGLLKHLKEFTVPRKFVEGPEGKVLGRFDENEIKTLEDILPTNEEVKLMHDFQGVRSELPSEERFCLEISQLHGFRSYVEALALHDSFGRITATLQNRLDAFNRCSEWLMESEKLADFMRLCLMAGNFLNSGSYAGNAPGFRLKDLAAIAECKSNQPNFTLLDFVVRCLLLEDREQCAQFLDELSRLDAAKRVSLEDTREEIAELRAKVCRVKHAFEGDVPELRVHMEKFVATAEKELESLTNSLNKSSAVCQRLAAWFCEDVKTFDVEECFSLFSILQRKLAASIQIQR